MAAIKRLGILTSGGDCAGLNAVLRAVTHRAVEGYGWTVVGLHNGTAGLMARPVEADGAVKVRRPADGRRRTQALPRTTLRRTPRHP